MINFEARCTSLKYGKSYDHGVNLLLLMMYFYIETKINVFCSSVNSFDFVPKMSKFMVIYTGMFEIDNINFCLMSANLEQCRI
jgi:hypothetical protein